MTDWLVLIGFGSGLMFAVYLCLSLIQQALHSTIAGRFGSRLHAALPSPMKIYLENLWLGSQQHALTGSSARQTYSYWLMHRLVVMVAGIILFVIPQPNYQRLLLVLAGSMWLLKRHQQRRYLNAQIERQWPATLDIYSMLLLSGLSQRAAIYAMATLPNPSRATWLLQGVQRDIQTGTDLELALNQLSQSQPSVWIQHFVTASIQSLRYGSQLAETLLSQADEARQKQIIDAEKRAQEVGVKLLFPLLFCFFPVTFLIILGPLLLRFLHGG
ncbi:MAG TPA: type II secretion system F family protein [Pseudidiomarina sp.]|nr:type II secretion system F family protein [Pseudidiomarina sp.]